MFGRAVGEGNEIVTGDYLADDRFVHSPAIDDFARQAGIASMIAAPLVGESGPLGVLGIFTARRDAYGDEEVALSKSLATQATIALTNARLIDELKGSRADVERRADAERTLREIGTGISALRESNEVVRRTVDEAVRLLDADGAEFDLVDAETGLLQGVYMSGGQPSDDEWPGEQHGTADVGVSGVALRTGSAFRTGDYMGDERFTHAEGPDQYASVKGIRSVISAPLVGEHGPFGTVTVWSTRPEAFSERDEALLLALVTQAAIALTNARLIAALEASKASIARRADAERALREISVRITAIHDPASVLQRVVDEACRLVGADGARIDLLDETSGEIRWAYSTKGLAASDETRFTKPLLPGEGVAGRVLLENQPIMTGDYLADPEIVKTPAARKSAHETGIRSILAVPLPGEHGAFGALSVLATAPDAFDDDDVAVIEALAPQAAIAVANARLIDELARSKQELAGRVDTEQALREIAARITAIRDPDEVLQLIVDEARRLLGSDGAHLTFMAEERTHLVPVVASGVDDATRRWMLDLEFPLDGGINGLAASLGRPIRTDDYLVDPRVPHEPDDQYVAARLGIRGCAVAPLRAPAGEIIGTLAVSFRTPREVDDESVARLQVLADQAAIAVTNARLDKLLSDSESRYRHLVENSPDLVWSVDADGRFTFLSETCERLTGWAVEELIGGHFGGIVHPSSQEVAEIDWTAGLGEGSSEIRGHVNLLHRDGHPIPAEFVAVSRIEGGAFVGANGSVRDMSERDRLERELQASEERYRFLVENSPDIVFSIDADGLFTYVSETIEQITGWLPAQATGRHFGFLIAEHSQPTALERWETLRQDPTSLQVVELDLVRPDGSFVPVEVSAIGIAARDGRFAGIHGSTRDISERRRLERDLRESEERYRYLVRASPDVVWAVDDQGVLTFMGDRVTELTGWTPDELVGKRFDFLTMPEYLAQSEEIWEGVRRDPGSVFPLRILMPRKSGDPIPVEVWITGSVHDGAFVGAHGSIRDMRENERLEGDLRRQAAELAAGDARAHLARELHDSVTQALFSMTLMTRSVEMLLSRDPEAAAQRLTTLRELQRDALAEMRALIFELRPGGLEEGGLVPALRRHAAAVQGRIGLPVVVEAEVDARLPADVEDVLYRIAQEALHNVVKHARARTVRLTLSIHDDTVRLAVVDDGAGFDPAQVPAGHLGLAGMKARAETIGAELAVRTRPGRGTTIEVTVTSPTAVPAVVAED